MEKIGFIGLGLMGQPMAKRLLDDYSLYVYNRTTSKADDLVAGGATLLDSPRAVADLSDVIIIMVSDDDASNAILTGSNGVFSSTNRPIVINMSTISLETSKALANQAKNKGYPYIEAPVSGTVGPARDGTLTIIAAGESELINKTRELLSHFGKDIYQFPKVGDATKVKLLINLNLAVQTAILSETLTAASSLDLDQSAVLEVINNSAVSTIISKVKGPNMINGEFPTAFPYSHMLKDLNYGTQLSDLPLAERAKKIYQQAVHDLDFSAIYKTYQDR